MSISVNYILEQEKERKKNAARPIPVAQEPLSPGQGGVVPAGAIESRTANYINNNLNNPAPPAQTKQAVRPAQAPQPQQQEAVDYSKKPASWTDDEYNAVRQIYSDDQIQQIYNQPDPQALMDGIFSSIYQKNTPAPVVPDEKAMKRQRTIAGIGDILGLIAQAAAGSAGAINRPRSFEQSAMGQLAPKQQEVYDRYLKRTDDYGRGLINAQMQDYLKGVQDWKQTQANIAKTLDDYRDYQIDVAKQQQDAAYKREQAANTARRTSAYEKSLESQMEDRRRRTDIAATTAANSSARTAAYIEKLKSPTTTSTGKADYQLVIPANANDPDAAPDQFGKPVRVFGMSNGEMDRYAREALADDTFKKNHPELFQATFGQKLTTDDKRNIAAVYLQEQYEQGFIPPRMDARTGAGNQFSGQVPSINIAEEEQIEEPFNPELDATELDEEFAIIY